MVTKDRYWKILWFDYGEKRQHCWESGGANQVCGKNKAKSKNMTKKYTKTTLTAQWWFNLHHFLNTFCSYKKANLIKVQNVIDYEVVLLTRLNEV